MPSYEVLSDFHSPTRHPPTTTTTTATASTAEDGPTSSSTTTGGSSSVDRTGRPAENKDPAPAPVTSTTTTYSWVATTTRSMIALGRPDRPLAPLGGGESHGVTGTSSAASAVPPSQSSSSLPPRQSASVPRSSGSGVARPTTALPPLGSDHHHALPHGASSTGTRPKDHHPHPHHHSISDAVGGSASGDDAAGLCSPSSSVAPITGSGDHHARDEKESVPAQRSSGQTGEDEGEVRSMLAVIPLSAYNSTSEPCLTKTQGDEDPPHHHHHVHHSPKHTGSQGAASQSHHSHGQTSAQQQQEEPACGGLGVEHPDDATALFTPEMYAALDSRPHARAETNHVRLATRLLSV